MCQGDASQGAGLFLADYFIGNGCFFQGLFRCHSDKSIKLGIVLLDTIQKCLGELSAGKITRGQALGHLGQAQVNHAVS
jgi:hypothetical protein